MDETVILQYPCEHMVATQETTVTSNLCHKCKDFSTVCKAAGNITKGNA